MSAPPALPVARIRSMAVASQWSSPVVSRWPCASSTKTRCSMSVSSAVMRWVFDGVPAVAAPVMEGEFMRPFVVEVV